jgi:outer membrane autotransporter protein
MGAGSGMSVDIDGLGTGNGAGNYDHLQIDGTGNQFLIGENVTLTPQLRGIPAPADNTFTPALGDTFRIVTADSGIDGRFTTVEQPADGMADGARLYAFYNVFGNNSVDLRVIPDQWEGYLALNGGNENAQAAGEVLDTLIESDTAGEATQKQQELLYSVAGATSEELPGLATELSGEMHAAVAAEVPLISFGVQSVVSNYIGDSQIGGDCKPLNKGVWFTAVRSWDQWHGDSVASAFDADRYQYVFGFDFLTGKKLRLGAGYSFSSVDLNHSAYQSNGSITAHSGFVYGQYRPDGVVFEGIASLGPTTWKITRPEPLGLNPAFTTHSTGTSGMLGLSVKVPMKQNSLLVQPYASATLIHNDRGALNEGDAQSALFLPGYSMDGGRFIAGITVGSKACDPLLVRSTFNLGLGVGYDTERLANSRVEASLADVPFTIKSPDVSQTFLKADAGATLRLASNGYGYVNYAGLFRSGAESQSIELGVKFAF